MKLDPLLYIAVGVSVAASYAAYVTVPAEAVMGDVYRILYVHVPVAWISYLAFAISLVASLLFLRTRRERYDTTAEVSAILGLVYGAVTLISGAIWANAVWGLYWNWDPRETATLVLWIAYLGYVAMRRSIPDANRRGVIGAVYNILAFATVPLSYLSIILLPTLHPQVITVDQGISMTPPMIGTLIVSLIGATTFFVYLLLLAGRVRNLEGRVDALLYASGTAGGA